MSAPEPIQMPPQIWGPIFWATLHIASLGYADKPTDRQRKNMQAFLESMIDVLPCPICRHHYELNLKEMPLNGALDTRVELIKWVFDMHNRINVQLGKREFTFAEFVESMRHLEMSKKGCPPSFNNSNNPIKIKPFISDLGPVDAVLLGTGVALVGGTALYYIYNEIIRKSK
jgi:hypothetical protein